MIQQQLKSMQLNQQQAGNPSAPAPPTYSETPFIYPPQASTSTTATPSFSKLPSFSGTVPTLPPPTTSTVSNQLVTLSNQTHAPNNVINMHINGVDMIPEFDGSFLTYLEFRQIFQDTTTIGNFPDSMKLKILKDKLDPVNKERFRLYKPHQYKDVIRILDDYYTNSTRVKLMHNRDFPPSSFFPTRTIGKE